MSMLDSHCFWLEYYLQVVWPWCYRGSSRRWWDAVYVGSRSYVHAKDRGMRWDNRRYVGGTIAPSNSFPMVLQWSLGAGGSIEKKFLDVCIEKIFCIFMKKLLYLFWEKIFYFWFRFALIICALLKKCTISEKNDGVGQGMWRGWLFYSGDLGSVWLIYR